MRIPTGYIYEWDASGDPGKMKLLQDLKLTAKWIQHLRGESGDYNFRGRFFDPHGGQLRLSHIDPSEPTLDMRAAKGERDNPVNVYDGEDKDSLAISYEYKDGTRYHIFLETRRAECPSRFWRWICRCTATTRPPTSRRNGAEASDDGNLSGPPANRRRAGGRDITIRRAITTERTSCRMA